MLTISDLTFRMEGRLLFEGASAFVPDGHRVGLVGRNGTGKTTLFRLIAGDLQPEGGTITRPKLARLGMVRQEAPAGPTTLIDTVLAADKERLDLLAEAETASDPTRISDIQMRLADIGAHSAPARAAEILAGLGFSHEAQQRACSEFSGGWRMRVSLAAILFSEPDLLLLDEPTNYLDLEGTIWLETYLRTYPHTVLMISHDRDLLNRAVGSILHLEQKKLTIYTGGYDRFEDTRAMKLALQEAMRKKQETARKHMQSFVDRFRYKASKATQAQSRLKALQKMKPIAAMIEDRVKPFIMPSPQPQLAPPIIAMDEVDVAYGDGPNVLSHVTARIDHDDRIALLGANGNGKSTFAKLLAQRLQAKAGRVTRAPKLRIGYFAQHQLDELRPEETPVEHMARLMPGKTTTDVRKRLGAYGFGIDLADTEVERLSGGEKARMLFALSTFDAPHMLILDEPTNHLDVDSREALAQALNEYEGAVILISHDRHLIDASVDRLWLVADGRVGPFEGDLDDYRRYLLGHAPKPDRNASAAAAPVQKPKPEDKRAAAEKRASLSPLKKRADQAEREYTQLSGQLANLEVQLADPKLYNGVDGAVKSQELLKKRAEMRRKLETTEAAWLEAQDAYEAAAKAAG